MRRKRAAVRGESASLHRGGDGERPRSLNHLAGYACLSFAPMTTNPRGVKHENCTGCCIYEIARNATLLATELKWCEQIASILYLWFSVMIFIALCLFVYFQGLFVSMRLLLCFCFTSTINSYGHVGTVS